MSDHIVEPAHELFDELSDTPTDSIGDRLKKRREEIAANRWVDLDIPGYDGALFCRYNLISGERLHNIAENVRRTIRDASERGLAASCDTLIAACDEFYVRDGGREKPAREVLETDRPVRYDRDLARLLGFEGELGEQASARGVVLKLFVGNDVAIAGHNLQLSRWMLQNGTQINDALFESGEL